MAAYNLPPPPGSDDPLIKAWLFELFKRNSFLVDSSTDINGLNDVVITSVGDNEVLAFDSGSGTWINQTALEVGFGSVTKVGTPVNNEVAVWTGDGTLEGEGSLTFDGTELKITGANIQLTPAQHIEFGDNTTYISGTSADNITFICGSTQQFRIDTAMGIFNKGITTGAGGELSKINTQTYTTTQLEDVTDIVNTEAHKVVGTCAFNSTTNKPVWAAGTADNSVWVGGDGATLHTPA